MRFYTVRVGDENDNAPLFHGRSAEVSAREQPARAYLATAARDPDGRNGPGHLVRPLEAEVGRAGGARGHLRLGGPCHGAAACTAERWGMSSRDRSDVINSSNT